MKFLNKTFVLMLCTLFWTAALDAREITVTGTASIYNGNTGGARNQAIKNAQRQAVEQGVGTLIDTQTLSENFEVVKDEILSSSRGYVSNYEIVNEGVNDTVYEVTIRAEVSEGKIKDKLTTLRILHKKMGNKRLMIVYVKRDPKALPRNQGAVNTTLGSIRDELTSTGFRVFNENAMNKVYKVIETAALVDRPVNNLIALALDQHAEILVQFEIVAGKRSQRGGMFYATKATVKIGVYDVATGRQIADVVTYGKEMSANRPGSYDWYNMLEKSAKRAGREGAKQAIDRISSYYQSVGDTGNAYLLVFRNYSIDQEDSILDYLENTGGFKQLTELQNTPKYLEIELFSSESKSRLRRKIRRGLQDVHIELITQSASGNRMIFVNPKPVEASTPPPAETLEQ